MRVLLLLLLAPLAAWGPARAVHPGCECLLFTGTFGKQYGTFSSPDYPRPYPDGVGCLLYTFLAAAGEIVELTFKDFDVQKTHLESSHRDLHARVSASASGQGALSAGRLQGRRRHHHQHQHRLPPPLPTKA